MKKKSFTLLVLLIVMLSNPSFAQTHKSLKGIEKDLDKILEVTKAPGFAVAIVKGNKVLYAKGFGYQDLENKIPMNQNTLMAIGSSSKAFTSAILGQLRHQGKLSFKDSPSKYIKELKFHNNELNNGVNIRDLMTHQTGIPRHDFSWYLFPSYNRDSLIQRIQYHESFTGLRQQWYYNNFMFLVQGVIAERITNKSWEQNVRERFFKPLGMHRSNLSIKELEKSSNAAIGYYLHNDSISRKLDYYRIAGMAPAGSINSSVKEMTNWLKLWINNGKYNREQILPETYVQEAISSQAVVSNKLPKKENPDMFMLNYGYAWFISAYKGHYKVEHGGNIDGFSASVALYPTVSLGVVVLANQDGSAVPFLVSNTVADRLLNVKRNDWAKYYLKQKKKQEEATAAEKQSKTQQVKNTTPSHALTSYKGNYVHPGYGKFNISLKKDSLFANYKRIKFYLKHLHYNVFEAFEVSKYGIDTTDPYWKFNFTTNNAGEIATVKMNIELELDTPIEFKRVPKIIELELSELKIYEGEYDLAGTNIKVYTKEDKGLYLFISGQPEYQLMASEKNSFIIKDLEGYKVQFTNADNGNISELILIQPNGTFKAKKK